MTKLITAALLSLFVTGSAFALTSPTCPSPSTVKNAGSLLQQPPSTAVPAYIVLTEKGALDGWTLAVQNVDVKHPTPYTPLTPAQALKIAKHKLRNLINASAPTPTPLNADGHKFCTYYGNPNDDDLSILTVWEGTSSN